MASGEKVEMKRLRRWATVNVDQIKVEDVAALYWYMPKFMARGILNTGVRRGEFMKNEDGTYKFIGSTPTNSKGGESSGQ